MLEQATRTIIDDHGNEHTYTTIQFGTLDGFKLWAVIQTRMESDLFDEVVDSALGGTTEGRDPVTSALHQAALAVGTCGDADLLKQCLRFTSRDGTPLTDKGLNTAFQGNYGELIRALSFVFEENFKGFLSERVGPLRAWGTRIGDHLDLLFRKMFKKGSEQSVQIGQFLKSGLPLSKESPS